MSAEVERQPKIPSFRTFPHHSLAPELPYVLRQNGKYVKKDRLIAGQGIFDRRISKKTEEYERNRRRGIPPRRKWGNSEEILERIAQRKLHHARLGQRPRVQPDGTRIRKRAVESYGCGVKAHGIGQVVRIGAETNRLAFREAKRLVKASVNPEEALPAENIARAGFTGIGKAHNTVPVIGSSGRIVSRGSDIEGKRLAVHIGQLLIDRARQYRISG